MSWRTELGVEDRRTVQVQIKRAYLDSCPTYDDLLEVVMAIDEEFLHAVSSSADEYYAAASRFGAKVRNKRAEFVDRGAADVPYLPPHDPFGAGKKKSLDEPLEVGEIFDLDAAFKKDDKKKLDDFEDDGADEMDLAEGLSKSIEQPGDATKSEDIDLAQALSASIQTAEYDAAKTGSRPARGRTDFASRWSGRDSDRDLSSLRQRFQRNAFSRWQQKKATPVVPPTQYASQKKQRQAFSKWAQAPQAPASAPAVSASFKQARARSRLNRLNGMGKFSHKPALRTQFSL